MNPFDYVNSINTKKEIPVEDYNSFIVNRAFSFFNDTILYANEMNINHHLDDDLKYRFLINIIKKKKRFTPWVKSQEVENLDIIKEYYGYSNEKAKSVLSLLNDAEIEELKLRICKGGKRKR